MKKTSTAKKTTKKKTSVKKKSKSSSSKKRPLFKAPLKKSKKNQLKKKEKEVVALPSSTSDSLASEILHRLRETFVPFSLSLRDLSEVYKRKKNTGKSYFLSMVSEVFLGLTSSQRQNWVNAVLHDLFKNKKIIIPKMDLKDPSETTLKKEI